jgi:DNA-binding NarL/FixJ family response regulator
MIRVVIAEAHAIVRQRLEQLCRDTHDVTVDGVSTGPAELLQQVDTLQPDLAIMSLSLQPASVLQALRSLKGRHPHIPVILMSLYDHESYALCALEAGATGYLMMEHAREQLIETIRMFVLGGPFVTEQSGQFAAI